MINWRTTRVITLKKRLLQIVTICVIMLTIYLALLIPGKTKENVSRCWNIENKIEQLYCNKVELVKQRKMLMWERDAYIQEVQTKLWVMNKQITGVNAQVFAIDQQIHSEQREWVEYDQERIDQLLIPDEMGNSDDPKWSEKLSETEEWWLLLR